MNELNNHRHKLASIATSLPRTEYAMIKSLERIAIHAVEQYRAHLSCAVGRVSKRKRAAKRKAGAK
jgi:hypothetical protein